MTIEEFKKIQIILDEKFDQYKGQIDLPLEAQLKFLIKSDIKKLIVEEEMKK